MNTTLLLIRAIIAQKIAFRKDISSKYVQDRRNHNSVLLLENLLHEPEDVSTAALDGFSNFELRRATNYTCHRVGFHVFPADMSDLISLIAETAMRQRAEINAVWGAK
jgi:hypothetical protein